MTKSELIDAIAARADLTKARAEMVVNCVFDTMTGALQDGQGIEIGLCFNHGTYQSRVETMGSGMPSDDRFQFAPRFGRICAAVVRHQGRLIAPAVR